MYKKLLCLLLALLLVLGSFVACDLGKDDDEDEDDEREERDDEDDEKDNKDDEDENPDGGDLIDGNWEALDFGDATLTISVSINDPNQVTFKNAGLYTKGPDKATTETVPKKVLARNKKVAEDLNIKVQFQMTDWTYSEILAHLEQLVSGDPDDAPDIYNNDIYAMVRGMMSGYLWNITNPGLDQNGKEVKSYFDFNNECWYKEYMDGTSFDKNKQYLLAGDYNIDIIRFAWVFFVNIELWDATYGSLQESGGWGYNTYESVCAYIDDTHDWFFQEVIALAALGHVDGAGGTADKTDVNDDKIGLCINNLSPRIFTMGSGVSIFEWTKNGKESKPGVGTPSLVTDTSDLVVLGQKYTELYNSKGVLPLPDSVIESTTKFMDGKIIMTMAELGEMESAEMRNTKFRRGILPFPRYSREVDITTVVHDQAEVTAILNNAKSFNMASAYMQYINEMSVDILDTYYEEVLKFKYNDSQGARDMIDVVHESIDTPFELLMQSYICGTAGTTHIYEYFYSDARHNKTSFKSNYDNVRGTLQTELDTILQVFAKLQ